MLSDRNFWARRLDFILKTPAIRGDSDYLLDILIPDLKDFSAVVNGAFVAHVLDTPKAEARLPMPGVQP